MSATRPRSRNSRTRCSPKPSTSIDPRPAKCSMLPARWNGHSRSTQRVSLSPSGRTRVEARGQGQVVGNSHGGRSGSSRGRTGPTTSGITSPARRTTTTSPGADVLDRDLVLVVEGGLAHVGPADEHRLELGVGRGAAGAPHRHHDRAQPGGALLRRELVGDRPPRRPGGGAQDLAGGQVVDLHHRAVDVVVESEAVGPPALAVGPHLLEGGQDGDLRVDREPHLGEEVERLPVAGEGGAALHLAQLVAPHRQLPLGGDGRVLLAQGAGRRVAGVDGHGVGLAALGQAGPVELLLGGLEPGEGRAGHVDLAPHLEEPGRARRPGGGG